MKQEFALDLAKRIEKAINTISDRFEVAGDVAFAYHRNDKGKITGMDVTIKAAADISGEIPNVRKWHPQRVATHLVPMLENLAMAS